MQLVKNKEFKESYYYDFMVFDLNNGRMALLFIKIGNIEGRVNLKGS